MAPLELRGQHTRGPHSCQTCRHTDSHLRSTERPVRQCTSPVLQPVPDPQLCDMQPHAILEIAVYPVAQHKIQHVKRLVVSNAALTDSKRNLAFVVGRKNCECNREGFTRHVKAPFPKLLDDRKNKRNVQWKRP